jgi:serine phosphatase RsbU (regulator of sigma subunit)/Tfp pilus assembly protein PilF
MRGSTIFGLLMVLGIYLFPSFGLSQNRELDSLNQCFQRETNPDTLLKLIEKITYEYAFVNPDTAIVIANRGINFTQKTGRRIMEANIISNLAEAYRSKSEYDKAIDLLIEAIKIHSSMNNSKGEGNCLNRMGAVYLDMNDFKSAEDYFLKALVKFESVGFYNGISSTLNNLGACYFYTKNYSKAEAFFQRSLDIEISQNNLYGQADGYLNIGAVAIEAGNFEKALNYNEKAREVYLKLSWHSGIAGIENNLGNIFELQHKLKEAEFHYREALKIARQINLKEYIRDFMQNLAVVLEKQGRYEEAFDMMVEFVDYRDSVLNEEKQLAVTEMATKYKVDQKEKENKILNQKAELQSLELEKKQATVYGVTAGLVLMVAVIFLIYIAYRNKKRANIILQEQRDMIAAQKKDLTDSIQYARHLQDAILPSTEKLHEIFSDHFILYKPKDIVSGDFFWFHQSGDEFYVAVADCTGHGVPGAMVSMVCNNALNRSVIEFGISDTGKILDNCADLIEQAFSVNSNSMKDGMDISLLKINLNTYQAQWSGANNPLWIIRNGAEEKEIEILRPDPQPIGSFFGRSHFHANEVQLHKGDQCFLLSDGYVDQFGGPSGKKYKAGTLRKFLVQLANLSMPEQHIRLLHEFESWKGNIEQVDDVCLLGFRI